MIKRFEVVQFIKKPIDVDNNGAHNKDYNNFFPFIQRSTILHVVNFCLSPLYRASVFTK